MQSPFRCVLHGSFRKHLPLIRQIHDVFTAAGIEVLAPKNMEIIATNDGFAYFLGEEQKDARLIELEYLDQVRALGTEGFSYFINPDGYLGRSAAYELGIAQATNIRCFFLEELVDHPAYVHGNAVWDPEKLVQYIKERMELPKPVVHRREWEIHRLWQQLVVPGSVVAAGAMIEYQPRRKSSEGREILLVKTHKWRNRYSIVGGKVRQNERLHDALLREVHEETGLRGAVGAHLCTFDQLKHSGYYQRGVQHLFVDNIVTVSSKSVRLNDEAQSYIWVRPQDALQQLDIEPNARETVEQYLRCFPAATL